MDEETAAMTTLPKARTCSPLINTSMAKITPAMGALNVAAIPAAAPQATMLRIRSSESLRSWPIVEPRAEPTWMIGPSRPAEPPVPIQRADATIFAAATLALILPPCRIRACITSGTPCPFASLAKWINGPTSRAPITGTIINR